MRTGELAKILGRDNQTIINWMNQPEIQSYLSAEALGHAGNAHRVYIESDVLVLNTVRSLVDKAKGGKINWLEIAEVLSSGTRIQEFPQNAISRDDRLIPMPQALQAAELMAMTQERNEAIKKIEDLKQEVLEEREEKKEMQTRIETLLREMGKLEGVVEMLERRLKEYNDQG